MTLRRATLEERLSFQAYAWDAAKDLSNRSVYLMGVPSGGLIAALHWFEWRARHLPTQRPVTCSTVPGGWIREKGGPS